MGFFDDLFGGGGDKETGSTTNKPDAMTQGIRKMLLGMGSQIANQSYPGYDWTQRTAGFAPMQFSAFKNINNLANSGMKPDYFTSAMKLTDQYANADAGKINTERVVDQNGQLGKISDYMNPYIQSVLDPQMREINEQGQIARNEIGAGATMGGAFGDQRHGITEAQNYQDQAQLATDTTGRAYSDAYGTAMGQRSDDLNRFMNVDTMNAQLREQMLGRKATGAEAKMNYGLGNDQMNMQKQGMLMNAGGLQQGLAQRGLDSRYEEFLNAREWPMRQFDIIKSIMSGQPSAGTQTTTEPGKSFFDQLLAVGGSALGSYFGGGGGF